MPPAVADFFWHDSTAPPARYAVAAGLTAEEVGKDLGFGVHPLRRQKTASLRHPLSRRSETAGEVRKGLGFGVQTLRLQKTAVPLRLLS